MIATEHNLQLDEARRVLRSDPVLSIAITRALLSGDSLEIEQRIDALLIASRAHILVGQYDLGEPLARQAAELSTVSGYSIYEGRAHNELGIYRFVRQDFNRALQEYQMAERLLKESDDVAEIARVYVNVANVYQHNGQVHESITMYERALDLARKAGDLLIQGKVLVNLSGLYRTVVYDPETAYECMVGAEQIFITLGDSVGLAKVKTVLAIHHLSAGEHELAMSLFEEALALRAAGAEPSELILNYDGLIATLIDLKRVEDARQRLDELKVMLQGLGVDQHVRGSLLAGEARVLLAEGDIETAVELWTEARQWLDERGYRSTAGDIEARIADGLQQIGDFEQANTILHSILATKTTTARERAEARLSWFKARLDLSQAQSDAEIERIRNIELATVVERLQELHRENDQYVAFLAHELKSPLNTIRSISAMLAADSQVTNEERSEYSLEINRISSRMFDLINQTLEVSKHRHHRPASISNARTVWEHVISSLRHVAAEKNIQIKVSFDASEYLVSSSEQPLVTILENLLSNALKFAPESSTVVVTVQRTGIPGRPPKVLLQVSDQGPGISSSDLVRLFRPFVTLTARPTARETSTGLGLHLLQKTVDQLDGRVWCESELGHGATFNVELPLTDQVVVKA